MPMIQPTQTIPENLFPYDERNKWKQGDGAIQFYAEDTEFESCWTRANRYPHMPAVVQKAGCCLTPDFSLYTDFPKATQIWNVYRSRLLGALWQHLGIDVIPSVVWGLPDSFEWCFDGLPVGGVVAVATNHVKDADEQCYFLKGFRELVKRCEPSAVLVYGQGFKTELPYFYTGKIQRYQSRLTQIYNQRKELEKCEAGQLAIGL